MASPAVRPWLDLQLYGKTKLRSAGLWRLVREDKTWEQFDRGEAEAYRAIRIGGQTFWVMAKSWPHDNPLAALPFRNRLFTRLLETLPGVPRVAEWSRAEFWVWRISPAVQRMQFKYAITISVEPGVVTNLLQEVQARGWLGTEDGQPQEAASASLGPLARLRKTAVYKRVTMPIALAVDLSLLAMRPTWARWRVLNAGHSWSDFEAGLARATATITIGGRRFWLTAKIIPVDAELDRRTRELSSGLPFFLGMLREAGLRYRLWICDPGDVTCNPAEHSIELGQGEGAFGSPEDAARTKGWIE
ncbi:hypothetical protein JNJ66_03230 [Candidatus Saccharibacteria bacterium]|nr:hypothetical protein [Candidatus Saccharibacteria bacterium]